MKALDSRETILVTSSGKVFIGGKPACSRCGRRPRRWDGRRWQSYCTVCHRDDARDRRVGKVEMLLTPEEREAVWAARAAAEASPGRHRR